MRYLLIFIGLFVSSCVTPYDDITQSEVAQSSSNNQRTSAQAPSKPGSPFNSENMMKIHAGMSSNQILQMFGTPKSVSQSVCGAATGRPWQCTTWEYGKFPYDRATFTFSGDKPGSLILNSFEINRD